MTAISPCAVVGLLAFEARLIDQIQCGTLISLAAKPIDMMQSDEIDVLGKPLPKIAMEHTGDVRLCVAKNVGNMLS